MQQFCLPIFSRQLLYEIEIHVTNFICIQYFFVINNSIKFSWISNKEKKIFKYFVLNFQKPPYIQLTWNLSLM